MAIQIRERLANDNSDNGQGDKHQAVHTGVNEVWEDVVDLQDDGDCAIEDGDASLRCRRQR